MYVPLCSISGIIWHTKRRGNGLFMGFLAKLNCESDYLARFRGVFGALFCDPSLVYKAGIYSGASVARKLSMARFSHGW